MSAWTTPVTRQQPYTAAQRRRGKGMKPCPRCKGDKRVDRVLFSGTKKCPRCQGEGQVETAATIRKRKRMQREWDAKQRQANRRPKQRLGT